MSTPKGSRAEDQPVRVRWGTRKNRSGNADGAPGGGRRLDVRPPLGWRPVTRVEGLTAGFDAAEQLADFRLAVATVAAEGADARELACFGPAGHGLGGDTEQRGDLRRGEQRLASRRRLDGIRAEVLNILEASNGTDHSNLGLFSAPPSRTIGNRPPEL